MGSVPKIMTVTLTDLTVLLDHVYRGAVHPDVGYEDCEQTIERLVHNLEKSVRVKTSDIESALWSANLLNELKQFWHPRNYTFKQWVKKSFPQFQFDELRNYFKENNP